MVFKNIHLGKMIEEKIAENGVGISRICNFMKLDEQDIQKMLASESIDTGILLKWCKLLEYDFFRTYSQHLILYAPPSGTHYNAQKEVKKTGLPQFKKNIYTREVIDFILEQIESGTKTKNQTIEEYNIPKTTLYKWINKYGKLKKNPES
ncbi:transposase [Chryseobacterium sp. 52]|uniref:transposase n=1 Tax=Chryseobacterium sp. 52 TaxID=2035213 RepID=UPI000C192CF5|nr:transposase [Chryseobacterium sp. 52]